MCAAIVAMNCSTGCIIRDGSNIWNCPAGWNSRSQGVAGQGSGSEPNRISGRRAGGAGSASTGERCCRFHVFVVATTLPASLTYGSRESGKTLPIFWARGVFITFYADCGDTRVVQKSVAGRCKVTAAQKNVKNIPFEGKPPKVPCFCEGDTFLKISPSTISREFFIPFAKTGGKASILVRAPGYPQCHRSLPHFWAPMPKQQATRDGRGDCSRTRVVRTIMAFAGYANTPNIQLGDAKEYILRCTEKNEKRYLFEQKWPKVPCFCEEVPFSKGSPSTISRDLKVPLRKNWEKSIVFDLPRPAVPRCGTSLFARTGEKRRVLQVRKSARVRWDVAAQKIEE
jgi:hypothetical protein